MKTPFRIPGNQRWTNRMFCLAVASDSSFINIWIRFIGMTGGEIFHEMMLRQGVKHICRYFQSSIQNHDPDHLQLDTLEVLFFLYSTPSTIQNISNSFSQNTNKVLDTWHKVMREPLENLVSFWSPPDLAPPT